MRILIADDDAISLRLLEYMVDKWGHEVVSAGDGIEAFRHLKSEGAPKLAILDWVMPGMEGVEVCRKVRQIQTSEPPYIILLTALDRKTDVVTGLEAGADDYVIKPYHESELRVRLDVGLRVIRLREALAERVRELQDALDHVNVLRGILPICMHCHKIRTDEQSWEKIDAYLTEHTDADLSHSICPECLDKYYPDPDAEPVNRDPAIK